MTKRSFIIPRDRGLYPYHRSVTPFWRLSKTALTALFVVVIVLSASLSALSQSIQQPIVAGVAAGSAKKTQTQHQPEVGDLRSGESIERELARDNSHAYRARLKAGDYVRVGVAQKGIDVAVTVSGTDGKKII